MKKILSILACSIAAKAFLASCTPKDVPDGKCELTAFAISSSIAGAIDANAKTITLVIPTSVTSTTFKPTFTATEWDAVTIGGTPVTSGETEVTIADGTKVIVSDDVSALKTEYTIVVKANDQKAELVAVSFKAADNSLLENDVTPDAIASEMVVRVPGTAFRQELTVTVQAGFNDEIKVNNTAVESGSSIKVDTSFPIDITVTDAVAGTTATYVLKVGKILEYTVAFLGAFAEGTINDFTMAINPNDNMPYFAYTRKVGEESNNNVSVRKWNGSSFVLVGSTGLADASSRSASKPALAFAKDGTPYVRYYGGDVASKPTVRKFDTDWALVGTAGFTPHNNSTSYPYAFFIHPESGKPCVFWCGSTKKVETLRTMNFASFDGSEWSTSVVTGVIPALATDQSTGNFWTSVSTVNESKAYMASQFNNYGYYIHEVNADGTLSTIIENYVPADAPHGLPSNLQLKEGPNGTLYLLAAVRAGEGSMQIFTVDQEAKTLKTYGPGLPVAISDKGGISQDFGFAVNPVDGLTIIAFDDSENVSFGYLDDNLQWAWFDVNPVDATSAYYVEFDKNGNGYISYLTEAKELSLYKVALEEDILPE